MAEDPARPGVGDAALVGALRARVAGSVEAAAPLAPRTTLRVGGPAAALVRAERPDDLAGVAEVCADTGRGLLILGRGSNLLVADAGWPGVAVALGRGFRGVTVTGELVVAGAAEPMPALARASARAGLEGAAFGIAIPGTVGGAVRMNAGAHQGEVADVLEWVEVARLARGGVLERIEASALGLDYRHSELPGDAVVVRAGFRLRHGEPAAVAAAMREMRQWRRDHQPLDEPSCGSVFRNPAGDSAGRLVEAAGLKGHRIGGARFSEKHANFITVAAHGTARDVRALIEVAQARVAERFGITLQTEVVQVGFDEAAHAPGGGS